MSELDTPQFGPETSDFPERQDLDGRFANVGGYERLVYDDQGNNLPAKMNIWLEKFRYGVRVGFNPHGPGKMLVHDRFLSMASDEKFDEFLGHLVRCPCGREVFAFDHKNSLASRIAHKNVDIAEVVLKLPEIPKFVHAALYTQPSKTVEKKRKLCH
jgi:hypothetical protein